jgi:hypothetical protein
MRKPKAPADNATAPSRKTLRLNAAPQPLHSSTDEACKNTDMFPAVDEGLASIREKRGIVITAKNAKAAAAMAIFFIILL